jgi:hypothetical protein
MWGDMMNDYLSRSNLRGAFENAFVERKELFRNKQLNSSFSNNPSADITIHSSIESLNKRWVLKTLDLFFREHSNLLLSSRLELHYSYQEKEGKITKVIACLQTKEGFVFATGEGIDEYGSTNNLINNLELNTRLLKNNSKQLLAVHGLQNNPGGDSFA